MAHRTLKYAICSSAVILSGCNGYAVTINEQPVHQPPSLLVVSGIADTNLTSCIEQTIEDQQIVEADELELLTCTHGGIESLAGLEQFSSLEQLDLSENNLAGIEVLEQLPELSYLKLEGNPRLSCSDVETLADLRGSQLEIIAPEHCR